MPTLWAPVPEAAINENGESFLLKEKVGNAQNILVVKLPTTDATLN